MLYSTSSVYFICSCMERNTTVKIFRQDSCNLCTIDNIVNNDKNEWIVQMEIL